MSQPKKTQREPVRPKQIQLIHIAKGELGLDEDAYRALLGGYGVQSSKDLSAAQADALLEDLIKKGFRVVSRHPRPARRPQGKNVVHLASQKEIDKLNAVASLIRWDLSDGLQRFLEKRVGVKGGKVRTAGEAYRAIEALKKLFENGMKKAHGEGWWSIPFADPAVEQYIARHAPAEYRSEPGGKVFKRAAKEV